MSQDPKAVSYMPQLDSLRALAVIAVMFHHYLPEAHLNVWANAGVKLFFVLSGFLITGILLKSRDIREQTGQSWGFTIRQFYARRFLRIFPLYYFVIAVTFVINLEPVRSILVWLLTYTLNFFMAFQGWYVDHVAHFWTLAVEEQFYMFWPWVILFVPKRGLVPLCLFFILSGPFYRFIDVTWGTQGLGAYILTPACLDALCMGALLAMVHYFPGFQGTARRFLGAAIFTAGMILLVVLHFLSWGRAHVVLFDAALAMIFFGLIDKTAQGFRGIAGALLSFSLLTYLGKISYGLYVYHPFMPNFCRFFFAQAGIPYPPHAGIQFVLQAAATFLIASLSWFLMEKPINELKRYFNYAAAAPAAENAGFREPRNRKAAAKSVSL